MKNLMLLALIWTTPAFASKAAPTLKERFVNAFVEGNMTDAARKAYKDMPDVQKIEALQAVFDVTSPQDLSLVFLDEFARFLATPINVDHTFWPKLGVREVWQEWIKKQTFYKRMKVSAPIVLSTRAKVAPAAAAAPTKPSAAGSSAAASAAAFEPVPARISNPATADEKGRAAARAEGPSKPRAPSPIPAHVITKRLEGLGELDPKTKDFADQLTDVIRISWKDFDEEQKVRAASLFAKLSLPFQKAMLSGWKNKGLDPKGIAFFTELLPAEKEVKRAAPAQAGNPLEQMLTNALDELAQLDVKMAEGKAKLVFGLRKFVKENWDFLKDLKASLASDIKEQLMSLYRQLPADLQKSWLSSIQQDKDVTRAAIRFFENPPKPAAADLTGTIDELAKSKKSSDIGIIIDMISPLDNTNPDFAYGITQLGMHKFGAMSTKQKELVANLWLLLSPEVKEGILEAWREKAPKAKEYFEKQQ